MAYAALDLVLSRPCRQDTVARRDSESQSLVNGFERERSAAAPPLKLLYSFSRHRLPPWQAALVSPSTGGNRIWHRQLSPERLRFLTSPWPQSLCLRFRTIALLRSSFWWKRLKPAPNTTAGSSQMSDPTRLLPPCTRRLPITAPFACRRTSSG